MECRCETCCKCGRVSCLQLPAFPIVPFTLFQHAARVFQTVSTLRRSHSPVPVIYSFSSLTHTLISILTYAQICSSVSMAQTTPLLTRNQVQALAEQGRTVLIIAGYVYDVTSYQDSHPGGATTLCRLAGMDATSEFDLFHGQSADVKTLASKFCIGMIEGYSQNQFTSSPHKHPSGDSDSATDTASAIADAAVSSQEVPCNLNRLLLFYIYNIIFSFQSI